MKAVVYHGPRQVSVDEVPDARIEKPTDALVKITATNICGSDLHMYEGRTDFEEGRIFGHENVGEVVEVGDAVDKVRVGDMISAPFNVACGHCRNCEEQRTNYCLRANKPDGRLERAIERREGEQAVRREDFDASAVRPDEISGYGSGARWGEASTKPRPSSAAGVTTRCEDGGRYPYTRVPGSTPSVSLRSTSAKPHIGTRPQPAAAGKKSQ